MSHHRCFVALELPADTRRTIVRVQESLRSAFPDLRYTDEANLHLTLKFLGEISAEGRAEVALQLETVEFSPFSIELAEAGSFPPRIVWIAIRGADPLQQRIDRALAPLFEPEQRFMGHVTIARTKRITASFQEALGRREVPPTRAAVTSFSLQESHLGSSGPRYETIARFVPAES